MNPKILRNRLERMSSAQIEALIGQIKKEYPNLWDELRDAFVEHDKENYSSRMFIPGVLNFISFMLLLFALMTFGFDNPKAPIYRFRWLQLIGSLVIGVPALFWYNKVNELWEEEPVIIRKLEYFIKELEKRSPSAPERLLRSASPEGAPVPIAVELNR